MSLILGEPPLVFAPSRERRQFVPWLTRADLDLISEVEFGVETMLVASSLYDGYHSGRLRKCVREELGLGWALHPQLHLLQVDEDFVRSRRDVDRLKLEQQRAFLSAPFGGRDPISMRLGRRQAYEVAGAFLDLEREALASALITPTLMHLDRSPRTITNNLALLEASIDYFRAENLDAMADDRGPFPKTRQLFAAISVHASLLTDERFMRRLLEAYFEYSDELYGFWVQTPGFSSSVSSNVVLGLSDFVYPLQANSERSVVLDRVGAFGFGYLADGLAGYCSGTAAPEFVSFPPSGFHAKPASNAKARSGFALVSYNQVLLRNRQLNGPRGARGLFAYQLYPCAGCGYHDPAKPPLSNRIKKLHGFHWHRMHAAAVIEPDLARTRATFLRLVGRGEDASARLGEDVSYYRAMRATLRRDAAAQTGSS